MHACVHTINVCAPHGHTLKKKKRQTYVLTCFYDRNRPFLAFRNKHIPILEQNTAIVHLVFLRFFILGQILRGWTLHPWARLKRGPSGKLWAKCSYSIASTMTNFFSLFLYEPSDSELFVFKCPQASKDYWKALCRNNPPASFIQCHFAITGTFKDSSGLLCPKWKMIVRSWTR